jgi:hypothetical protein
VKLKRESAPELSGVVRRVILFQQTREFVSVKRSPASPQACEKLEFAACENRHMNSCWDRAILANQPCRRYDVGAVGEHRACEHALFNSQMIPEQTLEHGAQIGGGFEVAALIELGGL